MAVRPDHLPAPIPNARPSTTEINRKYGALLERQVTAAQQLLDRGGDTFGLRETGIQSTDWIRLLTDILRHSE
eukprot:3199552-Alexandrium_andersonii.AAC.1